VRRSALQALVSNQVSGLGAAHAVPAAEGLYVKGHGVVFTISSHLSLPEIDEPTSATKKPLSDWELARKEMRGEKVDPAERESTPRSPSHLDKILKVIADNGRHLSQLDQNENLTVAITYRANQCMVCHKAATTSPSSSFNPNETAKPASDKGPKEMAAGSLLAVQAAINQSSQEADTRSLILLADLHLRQGKIKEAVDAYQKAAQTAPSPEIYRKLAQAFLALGEKESNENMLSRAAQYLSQAQTLKQKIRSGTETAGIPLPSRIIITAPKPLLDKVGGGKISFDEFKKAVTVQRLDFEK
jgi:tetratricopeptide (TPR) repeat protein